MIGRPETDVCSLTSSTGSPCLTVFNHRVQCSCWFMPCVTHNGFLLYAQIKRFQKGSDFCWWSDCFEFLCQRASICPSAHECWIRGFGPSVTPFMKGRADCLSYLGHLAKDSVCVQFGVENMHAVCTHRHLTLKHYSRRTTHTEPCSSEDMMIPPLQTLTAKAIKAVLPKHSHPAWAEPEDLLKWGSNYP